MILIPGMIIQYWLKLISWTDLRRIIPSFHAEKAFSKIQYLFLIWTLENKIRIDEYYLNIIKEASQTKGGIILGKTLEASPYMSEARHIIH